MPKIYLVRHGKAAAGFGEDADPGLDELGHAQAAAAASQLAKISPVALRSSPLRRARETAMPLEARWNARALIDDSVAEIPSPAEDLTARVTWLRAFMSGTWDAADTGLLAWRQRLVDGLTALEQDTIIFSHFVAINVAAGHALGDPRVTLFMPDNCSITIFETDGSRLTLLERGHEAQTKIN